MDKFLIEFNKLTNDKYNYLRLDDVVKSVNEETNTVSLSITFVVPYDIYNDQEKFNSDVKAEIENATQSLMPKNVLCHFKYDKIMVIPQVIHKFVTDFIRDNYQKLFNGKYLAKDIQIIVNGENVNIIIPVDETIYSFCENKGVGEKLLEYLDSKYCAKNTIKFKSMKMPETEEFKLNHATKYVDDGLVLCTRKLLVLGKPFADPPIAIQKYKKPTQEATICGELINHEKKKYKKIKDGIEIEKIFYVIDIKDPLGSVMHCVYFVKNPRAKKSQADKLKIGEKYIVNGELITSNFNNALNMFVANIMTCDIDEEGTKQKFAFIKKLTQKANVPDPKPYQQEEEQKPITLFDEVPYVCPFLMENEFTIFDLETTGLISHEYMPKIVEIGACRIKNGQIVSTFETLVDPQEHIPDGASNVNHIFDYMVENAPIIADAIGPFLKYSLGSILVGHNAINFDAKILDFYAKENGYSFDYKVMDTNKLAIEAKITPKYVSLAYLCKYFKIENENAHRALGDVIATAKIFIELANMLRLE